MKASGHLKQKCREASGQEARPTLKQFLIARFVWHIRANVWTG